MMADKHNLVALDSVYEDHLSGCRLQRLELFNWGTFHHRVWAFEVGGRNALLTGDIGSGKSTLVDAVTTLLLPSNRISYNKAAGADTRERDLRSYVEGHFKSERDEATGASRSVGLRDTRHYSVILGVFANADFGTTVTLAQVFRAREPGQGQPERFFVVVDAPLSIAEDFADVGPDLAALRRRLRDQGAKVSDSFPEYGREFRRRLGIESEQAMDLFHQTVSMKAVDNLNDFVRSHMLEPFEAHRQIDKLIGHFDDLTGAHDAVLRARAQLELLDPLVSMLDDYDRVVEELAGIEELLHVLPVHFAHRTRQLLLVDERRLTERLATLEVELAEVDDSLVTLRATDEQLGLEIAGAGGDRLVEIERRIRNCEVQLPGRRKRFDRFNELLAGSGMGQVRSADQFESIRERVAVRRAGLDVELSKAQNELSECQVDKRRLDEEADGVNQELHSLKFRRSNLPAASLALRARLCDELSVAEDDLPFAGELIQVRADAQDWEGAAERVLHNFALSLLVPDRHYGEVAAWIDAHHLGARLVYFRIPGAVAVADRPARTTPGPLLADLLEVQPDSSFGPWLDAELTRRADHACVESIGELRQVRKGVTRAGQVKDRDRHEKNDRRRIDDRRDYVLGWDNAAKVGALVSHGAELQRRVAVVVSAIIAAKHCSDAVQDNVLSLAGLDEYPSWHELDWTSLSGEVDDLKAEHARITSSSDKLRALNDEREALRSRIADHDTRRNGLLGDRGGVKTERERCTGRLAEVAALLGDEAEVARAEARARAIDELLEGRQAALMGEAGSIPRVQEAVGAELGRRLRRASDRREALGHRIVTAMGTFRQAFPQEVTEVDDNLASAGEFRQLHDRVADDDLPRFEREFKRQLNENAIREIAGFAAQLNKQEQQIRDRIETINRSLKGIDYNEGRYIRLLPDRTPNVDVREFRSELRHCTDDVVGAGNTDQYSEEKFVQVKAIIERFKGREGATDVDRVWTRRVTDVRQWFVFSASERWRESNEEHEHYADSGGKSGGQKEKLAYTILAASLAYQFKLDWGTTKSKAFRFVVIDEAFGRGSELSTRYALELFTRLGLQLLIVTPLQKIHVIEPHVSAVGFVDNLEGDYSRLQCLSIAEYRQLKRDRSAADADAAADAASGGPAA
jgi:uncharacterized protein YPO0396